MTCPFRDNLSWEEAEEVATEQEEEREKLEALRKAWDERERTLARIQHDISLVDKEISLLV